MLIIFTSPKGGTGKTTLSLLYANYLNQVFKKKICILDFDKNSALSKKFKRQSFSEGQLDNFQVLASSLRGIKEVKQNSQNKIVLVDLEGKLTERYFQVLYFADLIVCPYRTDELTMEATLEFAMLLSLKKLKAVCIYVPNRIKHQAEKQLVREIEQILSEHGEIAPSILDTQLIEQLDFFVNSKTVKKYASAALSFIKEHSV